MEHSGTASPEEHVYIHSEDAFAALRSALSEAHSRMREDLEAMRAEHARASADLLTRMDALIARTAIAKANAGVK